MHLPRLVLTSYALPSPVAMIGVFKRCLRLIPYLQERFEIHLLHFGFVPSEDPLVAAILPSVRVHYGGRDQDEIGMLLKQLRPEVIVHGEAPINGSMRKVYATAKFLGIRQLAIDNYYDEKMLFFLVRTVPKVESWLLLGLMPPGEVTGRRQGVEIVPPLVRPSAGAEALPRDRVCLLGYDSETLRMGMELIRRLPPGLKVDVFQPKGWQGSQRELERIPGTVIRVHGLPSEAEFHQALARSSLVVCKNGFQQMAEALLFGTPAVAHVRSGGVEASCLPAYVRHMIRYLEDEGDIGRILLDVAGWLQHTPVNPWADVLKAVPNPSMFAAERLAYLVAHA